MDGRDDGSPGAAPLGPTLEPAPETGVISSVRKAFGFIATPSRSRDIFFHISALEDCTPEQLQEGTAVTFVPRWEPDAGDGSSGGGAGGSGIGGGLTGAAGGAAGGGGSRAKRPIATRVRLAPVGTRVRMTRLEPGLVLGFVSDPAPPAATAGAGATAAGAGSSSGPKGILRFLDEAGSPDHVFYSAEDVEGAGAALGATAAAVTAAASVAGERPAAGAAVAAQLPGGASAGAEPALPAGQLVLFRLCTDLRAAAQAAEQAAAAAARAQALQTSQQHQAPQTAPGRGAAAGPRRAAYQWAVEVRPVGAAEVAAHTLWRQQAAVLQLLAGAVQVRL